jgi:hypothetical protein
VGFLDDLRRRADEIRARQVTDSSATQRQAALADAACKLTAEYFHALMPQLNVLEPRSRVSYRLDRQNAFEALLLCEFRADARRRGRPGEESYDHVSLRWTLRSGERLNLVKDFLPDIEHLESRLRCSGARFDAEAVRDPVNQKLREMRYEIVADFCAEATVTPIPERGALRFDLLNVDAFEKVSVELPSFEVTMARLDDLARWILGEPNAFATGALSVRRMQP